MSGIDDQGLIVTKFVVIGSLPLDTMITVSTPQNDVFGFRLPGPLDRFLDMPNRRELLGFALLAIGMAIRVEGAVWYVVANESTHHHSRSV